MTLRDGWDLLKTTVLKWNDDDAPAMAASLAYFTVFSIAPILIIAVAVAGLIFGDEAAQGQLRAQLQELLGDAGALVIQTMTASAADVGSGTIATIIGSVVLLLGASGVFVALQNALNRIWNVTPDTSSSRAAAPALARVDLRAPRRGRALLAGGSAGAPGRGDRALRGRVAGRVSATVSPRPGRALQRQGLGPGLGHLLPLGDLGREVGLEGVDVLLRLHHPGVDLVHHPV